jgi:hypothetical protein
VLPVGLVFVRVRALGNMTQTEHEFDELILRDVLRELDSSALSIGEITRERKRVPYDLNEVRILRNAVNDYAESGIQLVPHPLDNLQPTAEEATRWLNEGFLFVSSLDLGVGNMIVKTDVGEGYFGVQRVRYYCYQSRNGFRYHPVGTTESLTLALTKLTALHRR